MKICHLMTSPPWLGWTAIENGLCRSIEGVENICCGGLCGAMLARLGWRGPCCHPAAALSLLFALV